MIRKYHLDAVDLKDASAQVHFETRATALELSIQDFDERLINGYASVFDNRDSHGDKVRAGAFTQTLADEFPRGAIKFLYQHNKREPLGLPRELYEDDKGLWGSAYVDPIKKGDEALVQAKNGTIDGLSIGYWIREMRLLKPGTDEPLDEDATWIDMWYADRELLDLKLAEYSLVTWGSNPEALVEDVKALRAKSLGIFEQVKSGDVGFEAKMGEFMDRFIALEQTVAKLKAGLPVYLGADGQIPGVPKLQADEALKTLEKNQTGAADALALLELELVCATAAVDGL